MEPIIYWIGDTAIRHGERDDSEMCLCGHESYFSCPFWLTEGGIGGITWALVSGRPFAVEQKGSTVRYVPIDGGPGFERGLIDYNDGLGPR